MPDKTIPRPDSLDSLTPAQAAQSVIDFIGSPQSSGRCDIDTFYVDRHHATYDRLRGLLNNGGRWTDQGFYLRLSVDDEIMMSNTPDEMRDHEPAMNTACGRVLITGLGLSSVVSGMLANPQVKSIDVIEFNPDVIQMVGPAYEQEPRVRIHEADALAWNPPADARWDFAWHDIWPTISASNLTEDAPSYQSLLRKYAPHCERQAAWALTEARIMQGCFDEQDNRADLLRRAWPDLSLEDRMRFYLRHTAFSILALNDSHEDPEADVRRMLEHAGIWEEAQTVLREATEPPLPLLGEPMHFWAEVAPNARFLVAETLAEWGLDPDTCLINEPKALA